MAKVADLGKLGVSCSQSTDKPVLVLLKYRSLASGRNRVTTLQVVQSAKSKGQEDPLYCRGGV